MKLIRHIVFFFQVLLFALSGESVAFASVGSCQKVEFNTHHSEVALQQTNLAFAARAPPYVAVNVATAGTLFHGNGDVRALSGAKGTGVAFAFLQSSIAPNTAASNIATAQRLADDLRLSSARSPFTPDGRLAPSAIQEGRQIIRAEDLGNPNIPAGYGKYESPTFQSPSGDFKVHYYYNPVTQDVVYDLDYRVIFNHQGNWP